MELPISGQLQGKEFLYPVRVYFSDTDAGGVVYHARYLDFAEHARSEMLRSLGGSQQEHIEKTGSVFVVRSITADYIKPARLDDMLTIRTVITKCARIIVIFKQEVYRDAELLCTLSVKAGYISMANGRPLPMPGAWKDVIGQLVQKP